MCTRTRTRRKWSTTTGEVQGVDLDATGDKGGGKEEEGRSSDGTSNLVERLRVRSDKRPLYTLDESDDEGSTWGGLLVSKRISLGIWQ
ncbi:hypothetical protein GUJ93_ZPchr0006g40773 [Zizania palustris]|uniref:Uncharacterized protein n=1 Tax=Zizania palustris TaxID=103762 RepID=A0A8J5S7V4_ZIZPA|nr:hypothetical protein GUJ93_ZPchr0006g40773 [Zizania palustris]KAG8070482.1 hypothetical protein GUJ93_ZPchr0006g40773 [Zizania palustris]